MKNVVVIDIGNSSISVGIFAGERLMRRLDIPTRPVRDPGGFRGDIEEFLAEEKAERPLGIMISSVVPELTEDIVTSVRDLSVRGPLVFTSSLNCGLIFDPARPGEIGADRIAGAVAATAAVGSPVAVVDFGTATTISVVRDGHFLGGSILPGMRLMGEALHTGTSKLPKIDLGKQIKGLRPSVEALGKDTTACMISGMIYGTAGAVERILLGIEKEEKCSFKVVATGGYASTVVPYMERKCLLDPDLTLKGLKLLYERNPNA